MYLMSADESLELELNPASSDRGEGANPEVTCVIQTLHSIPLDVAGSNGDDIN